MRRAIKDRIVFSEEIDADLRVLAFEFHLAGVELFVVGGAVRDLVLGKVPHDIDLASELAPENTIEVVRRIPGSKVVEVGISFGVIRAIMPSGNEYEIATFREDYGIGRRPTAVNYTSIEIDVLRRDFTMNAMFYSIGSKEIVDLVGGYDDVQSGIVRCVGEPALRFEEDRLRVLRALRFAAKHGDLHEHTRAALKNDSTLKGVSPNRVREEFLKGIVSSQSASSYIDLMDEFDMWEAVFPGLTICSWKFFSQDPIVLIAMLLHQNTQKEIDDSLRKMTYTKDEIAAICFLVDYLKMSTANGAEMKKKYSRTQLSDDQLRIFMAEMGSPNRSLHSAFIKFKPVTTAAQLMEEGFEGEKLGLELRRRHAVEFEQHVEEEKRRSER